MSAQVTYLCLNRAHVDTATRADTLFAHILCAYAGGPDSPDNPEGAAQVLTASPAGSGSGGPAATTSWCRQTRACPSRSCPPPCSPWTTPESGTPTSQTRTRFHCFQCKLSSCNGSTSLANMALLAGGFYLILSGCLDLLRRRNTQLCISFWQPVAPLGYLPGACPCSRSTPPCRPCLGVLQ